MKPKPIVKQLLKNSFAGIEAIACGNQFAFTDTHRLLVLNDNLGYQVDSSRSLDVKRIIEKANESTHIVEIDIGYLTWYISGLTKVTKYDRFFPYFIGTIDGSKVFVEGKWLLKLLKLMDTNVILVGDLKTSYIRINGNNGEFAITAPLNLGGNYGNS